MTDRNLALLNDFYEYTMASGFKAAGLSERKAYFDIFFREVPDGGGYVIAAGLDEIINYVRDFHFDEDDIQYLRDQNCFSEEWLNSLKDLSWLDNGELFISADNGVGYLDRENVFHRINTNDFNNSIDNMLIDFQGNLWFTSSRLGLLRMAPSAFRDVYSTAGMSRRVVNTIVKWQGAYYIGTDKGLDVVDGNCRAAMKNDLTALLSGSRIRCVLRSQGIVHSRLRGDQLHSYGERL